MSASLVLFFLPSTSRFWLRDWLAGGSGSGRAGKEKKFGYIYYQKRNFYFFFLYHVLCHTWTSGT